MGLIHTPTITPVGTARSGQVTTSSHCAFLSASQSNWAMTIMWETGSLAFRFLSPDRQLILRPPANTGSSPLWFLPPPRLPHLHHTHSHSGSSFFSSIIHPSFPRKRSPELSIHLMIHFFGNAITRSALAASEAASQWWKCHPTGGHTNLRPQAFGDEFSGLVMQQCLIYIK